ncbi:Dps family protein [Alistipes sp. ZOR0009]|uniref:Dps family protein n=1 Tax=Alistipes sp. ZOR0009 TaxID=1339253 RepID=UPI000645C478|nr:Dps family protein [Alistipes sp. ZOR0009]
MNTNLNSIGLDKNLAQQLAGGLNELLASYQIFYQNLRGFHWNIRGEKFFELHLKFEELYNDAILKIDEVAERILTLGNTPLHSYSDYIKTSFIAEAKNLSDAKSTLDTTLNNFQTLLIKQRELLKVAQEAGDEGSVTLLSDYISQQEKTVWMLSAYLNK